jgi:hypothetical protein
MNTCVTIDGALKGRSGDSTLICLDENIYKIVSVTELVFAALSSK